MSTTLPSTARTFPVQAEHRQRRVVAPDGLDDRRRLLGIGHDRVVQGAVRLDVPHPVAGDPGERVERPDLIHDIVGQLRRVDVDVAPTEADQVAIADLSPDRHAPPYRFGAHPSHDRRIAGVESARHVGARHQPQHRLVVAELPDPEPFAEITVQVEYHLRLRHR